MFYRYYILVLVTLFGSMSEGNITLSSQGREPICSQSVVLRCSFCDLNWVRFEERSRSADNFSVLTSNHLLRQPDYEEMRSDGRTGMHKLMITNLTRHNYTDYRCQGYSNGPQSIVVSNVWTLQLPASTRDCDSSEKNFTVMNINCTNDANANQTTNCTVPTENNGHGPQMEQDMMLKWISFIVILIPLVVLAVYVIVLVIILCKRRGTSSKATPNPSTNTEGMTETSV